MREAIVIGSGPSAPESYKRVKELAPDAITLTTNNGIKIERHPDWYFLSDHVACELWKEDARAAAKSGTTCVTLQRDSRMLALRGVNWFHVLVREGAPFEPYNMSGIWLLEFTAAVLRSTKIWVCGFDGYRDGEHNYFCDHEPRPRKDVNATSVQPITQRVVDKNPQTEFIAVGDLTYTITADNWHVL